VKHVLLALGLLVAGAAQAKVKVVATVGDLGALAREVGGDQVEVEVLALATQDPHFVDARPSLVVKLSRAHLLIANGMELEVGWLPALQLSARNEAVMVGGAGFLDVSTLITPLEVPQQKIERSMGDIHPGGNPHYTKDPRNGLLIARGIAQRLSQLDPANEKLFQANLEKLQANLKARIAEWEKTLAPYKGTPVVTFHRSWVYLLAWAGLTGVGYIEPKPGIQPNPTHVAGVLGLIKERKVPLILQEDWYSAAVAELLAKKTGATVVRVPGMAAPNQTYADTMGAVVDGVAKALAAQKK
jgi:zinc/manganese transport system substrate-binding protein